MRAATRYYELPHSQGGAICSVGTLTATIPLPAIRLDTEAQTFDKEAAHVRHRSKLVH
jgi:hypothetical protein